MITFKVHFASLGTPTPLPSSQTVLEITLWALIPCVETSSFDSKLDPFKEILNYGTVKTEDNHTREVDIPPQVFIFGPEFLIGHAVWAGRLIVKKTNALICSQSTAQS